MTATLILTVLALAAAFVLGRWYGRAERSGAIVQPCPPDCPECLSIYREEP